MPKTTLLTDAKCRAAKPRVGADGKPTWNRISDGGNLYLFVTPAGSKSWQYRFRFKGKPDTMTLGTYPAVGLAEARKRRDEEARRLAAGINPKAAQREAEETARAQAEAERNTFAVVCSEWFKVKHASSVERTRITTLGRIEKHILPAIGDRPFSSLTTADLIAIIRPIENAGHLVQASRVGNILKQVSQYAFDAGISSSDIGATLMRLIRKPAAGSEKHFPAVTTWEGLVDVLRHVYAYAENMNNGLSRQMRAALKLSPLIPQRSIELMGARWDEIDMDSGVWTLPVERQGKTHMELKVPLSSQARDILAELHRFRTTNFVFASGSKGGHLCGESVNKSMHAAGVPKGEHSLHGYRAAFGTLAESAGIPRSLIEGNIGHKPDSKVFRAYHRGDLLEQRRLVAQWWSDTCFALMNGRDMPKIHLKGMSAFE
ncbi:MAG: integrase arm-type DNA-binding domain-containing protein [Desulfovibrionaceae bacterium]|nr:integrase arm-type DNA-binding domain-containing protein [Desulfovibrionaceae bacterium]